MRRIVPFTLAAIVLAAIAAVAMAAGSSSADPSLKVWGAADAGAGQMAKPRNAHRLVVFSTEDRAEFVDVGAAGESAGDMFIFEGRAFNRPGGHVIGRLSVSCQLRLTTVACNGTLHLRDRGSIQLDGVSFGPAEVYPITGGTGKFAGAGGQLRVSQGPGGFDRLAFWLTH
jgi:hypothetical protein